MGTDSSRMSGEERNELLRRTMTRARQIRRHEQRRRRMYRSLPAVALVLVLSGGVAAALVISRSGAPKTVVPSGTGPATSSTTTTTQSGSGSVSSAGLSGFYPSSFTSVSLNDWWLLGSLPCDSSAFSATGSTPPASGSGRCPAIVRTTDGGSSFDLESFPSDAVNTTSGQTTGIAFETDEDGWAFGPGVAYTEDGGSSWTDQQLPGPVLHLSATDGVAFAVVCSGQESCQQVELVKDVIGSPWEVVSLPMTLEGSEASLVTQGDEVIVGGQPAGDDTSAIDFLVSDDLGASFSLRQSPCTPGLGGSAFAAVDDPSVLWAACPTGMMASAFTSSDIGKSWQQVQQTSESVEFSNGLSFAPLSSTSALAWPSPDQGLLLTTDGGSSYKSVLSGPSGSSAVWAGYSDSTRAYAIIESNGTPETAYELFESGDGGQSFTEVSF